MWHQLFLVLNHQNQVLMKNLNQEDKSSEEASNLVFPNFVLFQNKFSPLDGFIIHSDDTPINDSIDSKIELIEPYDKGRCISPLNSPSVSDPTPQNFSIFNENPNYSFGNESSSYTPIPP